MADGTFDFVKCARKVVVFVDRMSGNNVEYVFITLPDISDKKNRNQFYRIKMMKDG